MNKFFKWVGSASFYYLFSGLAGLSWFLVEDTFTKATCIILLWVASSAADTNKKLEAIQEHLGMRNE